MLTRPYPSYASLWTALAAHDMIEQIPRANYAVSLDRAREIPTSIGMFRIQVVTPNLYGGSRTQLRCVPASDAGKRRYSTPYILLIARTGHAPYQKSRCRIGSIQRSFTRGLIASFGSLENTDDPHLTTLAFPQHAGAPTRSNPSADDSVAYSGLLGQSLQCRFLAARRRHELHGAGYTAPFRRNHVGEKVGHASW